MTGVVLPTALSQTSSWQVTDWQTIRRTSPAAAAAGTVTVDCGQLDPDVMWLVDHLVAQSTSSTPTALRLYDTLVDPSRLLDVTGSGNLNSADYPAGLLVQPSTALVAVWSGAAAGAVCTINAQVRVLRRGGGS